jgi:Uncharacterized small membrane protein
MITAFSGALAVALGAFGAHALKEVLPEGQLQTFETANRYHFYHSFLLLIIYALRWIIWTNGYRGADKKLKSAQSAVGYGVILFCGSLYLLATRGLIGLESWGWLGAITPLGGAAFIAGWIMLGLALRDINSVLKD